MYFIILISNFFAQKNWGFMYKPLCIFHPNIAWMHKRQMCKSVRMPEPAQN